MSYTDGFCEVLFEKYAVSPEFLLRKLKGVKESIRAMGVPVVKGPEHATRIMGNKPMLVFSESKGFSKGLRGGMSKTDVKSSREWNREIVSKLPTETRAHQGRIGLLHEKAEAQALRRHGVVGEVSPLGHAHPSVIEREIRVVKKVSKKDPKIKKLYRGMRTQEIKEFGPTRAFLNVFAPFLKDVPGLRGYYGGMGGRWDKAYRKYKGVLKE